jgi:hypothetical protein
LPLLDWVAGYAPRYEDEPEGGLTCAVPGDRVSLSGGGVASGQAGLLEAKLEAAHESVAITDAAALLRYF